MGHSPPVRHLCRPTSQKLRLCFFVRSWPGRRARDRALYEIRAFLLRKDPKVSKTVSKRGDPSRSARALSAWPLRFAGDPAVAGVDRLLAIHTEAAYGDFYPQVFP